MAKTYTGFEVIMYVALACLIGMVIMEFKYAPPPDSASSAIQKSDTTRSRMPTENKGGVEWKREINLSDFLGYIITIIIGVVVAKRIGLLPIEMQDKLARDKARIEVLKNVCEKMQGKMHELNEEFQRYCKGCPRGGLGKMKVGEDKLEHLSAILNLSVTNCYDVLADCFNPKKNPDFDEWIWMTAGSEVLPLIKDISNIFPEYWRLIDAQNLSKDLLHRASEAQAKYEAASSTIQKLISTLESAYIFNSKSRFKHI